jgi:F0F1-type ATP synthase epsilon subunit
MLRVRLFRDRKQLFDGGATEVILPGEAGDITVLEYHAPLLCALARGDVQVDKARFSVRSGIARVERNRMTILAQ